jgi:hypothetical protein
MHRRGFIGQSFDARVSVMALTSREVAILEEAVAGISRVAKAVASLPARDHSRAFEAAERSYRKTARDLGYAEGHASGWAASLMVRLRAEVAALVEARAGNLDDVA